MCLTDAYVTAFGYLANGWGALIVFVQIRFDETANLIQSFWIHCILLCICTELMSKCRSQSMRCIPRSFVGVQRIKRS